MYRPGEPIRQPPPPLPFGPPPPHGPPFRLTGPCSVPPPGHLPPRPCGPYPASARDYLHNRPPSGHFVSPHCSSFSIDHSTAIALGGSQQIVTPAEPSTHPVPQWNPPPVERHSVDNSDRAGEEFLRCIAANKPLPNYLKGNMAYNLAEAFKSASILKETVKSDREFQKHVARSKSRSQSRSRGRSRAKSRGRSKSRVRSRSRGRSKSHACGKNRARSKSRARSRSWSKSRSEKKSHVRSKSRARRSKSRSSSSEKSPGKGKKRNKSPGLIAVNSSNNLPGNSLLEGLKLVMSSQDLEDQLPSLKDVIRTIKAPDEGKKVECVSNEPTHMEHDSQDSLSLLEKESMLLPHERVGGDFSWLQGKSQEDATYQKASELEDEESFLYGNETSSQINESAKPQKVSSYLSTSCGHLLDQHQSLQLASSTFVHSNLDNMEYEKIKTILKSLGSSSKIKVKTQGQNEQKESSPTLVNSDKAAATLALPTLNNPSVCQALESLQSLIKATKEKRTKSDCTSQESDKHKAGDSEERKREKQEKVNKMECLAKELDELLKQDGQGFITSVTGFYCQKCEEFIGDLKSAENHAAIRHHSNSIPKEQTDRHSKDSKGHPHHYSASSNRHPDPPDRKDHRDYGYHRDLGNHRNSTDHLRNWKNEKDFRSRYHDDDHKSHKDRDKNIFLKDEMKKERMLITVSHGPTPSTSNIRIKEEVDKEKATGNHGKVKAKDLESSKEKKGSIENDKYSDSTDDDEKSPKTKKNKKKKKKKEKKNKKQKEDKS